MKDLLNFVQDDWRNLPTILRLCLIFGFLCIGSAALGEQWHYHLPFLERNEIAFQVGVVIIFVATILAIKPLLWLKILYFQRRYPINRLNRYFYLVSFQNAIYLLDDKRKQRFHLMTQQTVKDLKFWPLRYPEIPSDIKPDDTIILNNTSRDIQWSDYKEIDGVIYTRDDVVK